jgi:hypothetical protein
LGQNRPDVSPGGHDETVDASLVISLVSVGFSAVALWVSYRQPFLGARLEDSRQAAEAVVAAIQAVRELVWDAAEAEPDPELVASRMYEMDAVCRANRDLLPREFLGIRQEVRAAATNYLGGAAGYTLDPGLKRLPFSDHDRYWWDISVSYLDYVVRSLAQWRRSKSPRVSRLTPFHQWRRDEDAEYHAYNATSKALQPALARQEDGPTREKAATLGEVSAHQSVASVSDLPQ